MRRLINPFHTDDSGAIIVIAAFSMFAIMALAALAIDGGLIQNDRSRAQNGADNAALAAAWAACEGRDPVAAGLATAAANGLGSPSSDAIVDIEDLGDDSFRVTVDIARPAEFGRAIGTDTIGARATATATCSQRREGAGAIPFGVPPSGFTGELQAPNPCGLNSGNCGRLFAWRLNPGFGEVGEDTRRNIAYGTDRILEPWMAIPGDINCSLPPYNVSCNILPSNTGVSSGQMGDGFIERLSNLEGSNPANQFTYKSQTLNGDTLQDVLGSATASPIATAFAGGPPPGWIPGLHGDWDPAKMDNHMVIRGEIAKCDSPRLASTLIVTADMTYNPASYPMVDHPDPWPSGSKLMKVLGHYFIYIDDPNDADDFQGSGNLKTASATVLWLDGATCADETMPGPAATNPIIREVGLTS